MEKRRLIQTIVPRSVELAVKRYARENSTSVAAVVRKAILDLLGKEDRVADLDRRLSEIERRMEERR